MLTETESVILNSRKFGDTSKILTLFSRDYGRLSILAKGARQKKNKFRSILEPINIISLTYYKRPNRDLHLLSSAEVKYPLIKIFDLYDNLAAGLAIIEMLYYSIQEQIVYEKLYQKTIQTLIKLDSSDCNPFALLVNYQIYLASSLGFGIDFDLNEKLYDTIFFSVTNGNFICADNHTGNQLFRIDSKLFEKIKKYSVDNELDTKVNFTDSEKQVILDMFSRYFSFHLEKKFYLRTQKLLINSYL